MGIVSVRFMGSGDAFGSGGRFNTCILISDRKSRFLVDCGASSLVAPRRFGVVPNEIGMILISHLHGDHFGGLPFFILDAQLASKRSAPLLLAGPPGLKKRVYRAMEVLFPGSSTTTRRFELNFTEFEPGRLEKLGEVEVHPFLVRHPCGNPPLALRIYVGGKIITYSGDTEWCETLLPAARGADLFIAEAYSYDKEIPFHLNFKTLAAQRDALGAKRIVLTHMGADMVKRAPKLGWRYAEDGKVFRV